ncbi:hypothetical protein [Endozoicomonas arenosclerae]|uniref:hypothetical protein n=1 Tax=Endozoicomonas arenosclerae TaxID=1633495 RepID=UPI000A53C703|nr:hypothetical protein [Endozoicomonas arenosclerae]
MDIPGNRGRRDSLDSGIESPSSETPPKIGNTFHKQVQSFSLGERITEESSGANQAY